MIDNASALPGMGRKFWYYTVPTYSFYFIIHDYNGSMTSDLYADGRIYNLQGRQMKILTKGFYIKNNKKIIVK